MAVKSADNVGGTKAVASGAEPPRATDNTGRVAKSAATQPRTADSDDWESTPVWHGENEFASRGQTKLAPLVGIRKGADALAGVQLRVQGQQSFSPGQGPQDITRAASDGTHRPESFVQAQAFSALSEVRETFDSLGLPLKFAQLVAAKSGQKELLATVNALRSEKLRASYFPPTEEMFFGTLVRKDEPIWDLGADSNVVQHEAGHFVLDHLTPGLSKLGDGGVLHEGYADAQAALLSRDPEIAEDYGLSTGNAGEALRSASNSKKISGTADEAHERGEVVAGYLWDIGEEIHTQLVGRPRNRAVDAEPLDAQAAREALKVLWTFPLYLGTKQPKLADVVAAVDRALVQLARGGKLDRRIDIAKLRAAARRSADMRELTKTRPMEQAKLVQAATPEAAAGKALDAAGIPNDRYELARLQSLPSAGGLTTYRFELRRSVLITTDKGSHRVMVPIEDDFVTVIKTAAGYEVKVGMLPEHYAIERSPSLVERFVGWIFSPSDAPPQVAGPQRSAAELEQHVKQDLERLLDPDPGWIERAKRLFGEGPEDVGGRALLEQSRAALENRRIDSRTAALAPRVVWRHGEVQLRLIVGPLTYYATLDDKGRIRRTERIVNALYE